MRTPLPSVLKALRLSLKKTVDTGECVITGCRREGAGLFQLCGQHRVLYASEQHKQAQRRVNARRQSGAAPVRPLIARRGKLTPWAKANPKLALAVAAKSQGELARKMVKTLSKLVKAA